MTVDYREAFVLEAELAAHSWTCDICAVAALKSLPEKFCAKFKHMKSYCERAYEVLPPYYKQRYADAANVVHSETSKALQSVGRT